MFTDDLNFMDIVGGSGADAPDQADLPDHDSFSETQAAFFDDPNGQIFNEPASLAHDGEDGFGAATQGNEAAAATQDMNHAVFSDAPIHADGWNDIAHVRFDDEANSAAGMDDSQTYPDVHYNAEAGVFAQMQAAGEHPAMYDIMPNFEPNTANADFVVGNPEEDMAHWEYQGDTNRCALFAQQFIVEDAVRHEIDIEMFEDIAEENGWFNDGTPPEYVNKMLDYYGIDNEMSYGNEMEDIIDCLSQGGKVIVTVDAYEIVDPNYDSIIYAPDDANHAIEVIGVDYSDPENPMVIMNDSGHPDGCGSMVPQAQFMDAWEDSAFQMVAAYGNAGL